MAPRLLAVWLCAGWCCAQSWEVGGAIGYGAYRDVRVNGAGAQATAGIRNRFVAGGVVTEDLYEHLSGEIRYQYQDGDPFLSLNGKTGNMQGQSHSFSYDVLVHVKPREEKLRPFVALGMGARWYRSTGPEPNPQPAPALAALTHDDDWKLLVTVGGGVTYKLPNHLLLRADFRDGITPFPKKIFVPAAGATDRGLFQMFTTTIGVGYWF